MDVSISKEEIEAIKFAIHQIRIIIKASGDKEYIQLASESEKQLSSILEKYKRRSTYVRLNNLADQAIRKYIKQHPGALREYDLRKLKKNLVETWTNE